jgi:hypothetical protein
MLNFKTFVLSEAGDNPYSFHLVDKDQESTRYEFSADGTPYSTTIEHMGGNRHAEVIFGTRHDDKDFGPHTSFHMTGTQGAKAAKIMSTVHHIVKRHVANHPELHTVGFTSDADEPSRVALYKRYTKRMGGITHDSNKVYDTIVHTIPADSYRK